MVRGRKGKEEFEYVSLMAPDLVINDVRDIDEGLSESLENVTADLEIHKEKHRLISKAKELLNNINNDIKLVEKYSKYQTFKDIISSKKEVKVKKKVENGEAKKSSKKDYFAYSKRALDRLKNNIGDVKKQLDRLY